MLGQVSQSKAFIVCISLTESYSSTRGLDASTALEFARALRIATDVGRATTIVTIYQASESLYRLFDKVCVIYSGKQIYFGAAEDARQYFIDMGWEPANRQTTADFLVAVTDPLARTPRAGWSLASLAQLRSLPSAGQIVLRVMRVVLMRRRTCVRPRIEWLRRDSNTRRAPRLSVLRR